MANRICLSAETGTLIFAVLNLMLSSMSTVYVTVMFVYFCIMMSTMGSAPKDIINITVLENSYITFLSQYFALMASTFISLLFAGFLMAGVIKKHAPYIKAYFVYGVATNVLSIFIGAVYLSFSADFTLAVLTLGIILLVSFGYWLILVMIYRTYKNFDTISSQYSHKPLEDGEKSIKVMKF